jgi:hypothetical protein
MAQVLRKSFLHNLLRYFPFAKLLETFRSEDLQVPNALSMYYVYVLALREREKKYRVKYEKPKQWAHI